MTVKLASAAFPLDEVLQLRNSAQKIYKALWDSASKDDTGTWEGTVHWSIKGLSDSTGSTWETVSKVLAELLEAGLITALGSSGAKKTGWRVTHPDQIEEQRALAVKATTVTKRKKRLSNEFPIEKIWESYGYNPLTGQLISLKGQNKGKPMKGYLNHHRIWSVRLCREDGSHLTTGYGRVVFCWHHASDTEG